MATVFGIESIPCEMLRKGDVFMNPHLGMSPPCLVTDVHPTPLLAGRASIHYEHGDGEGDITKLASWCEPGRQLDILDRNELAAAGPEVIASLTCLPEERVRRSAVENAWGGRG